MHSFAWRGICLSDMRAFLLRIQAKGSQELYAAAGEEIFCFDLRKLGGGTTAHDAEGSHPLRTPRGLAQADAAERAAILANAGDSVQNFAKVHVPAQACAQTAVALVLVVV